VSQYNLEHRLCISYKGTLEDDSLLSKFVKVKKVLMRPSIQETM